MIESFVGVDKVPVVVSLESVLLLVYMLSQVRRSLVGVLGAVCPGKNFISLRLLVSFLFSGWRDSIFTFANAVCLLVFLFLCNFFCMKQKK